MVPFQSAGVCKGLPTEWENKLETTTQFPVDPGTVVEVTCSDPGNNMMINTGSSHVTCSYLGTVFDYEIEPHCTGIKTC